jgi:CheY-like chemotaxis protein
MLKDLGHFVRETRSGREALDLLKGGVTVDAVVTDYAMRGMTGLELAREIRARWPEMPIILATGYAELPVPPGFDLPRLHKPFDQKALAEAVCRLVRPKGGCPELKIGDAPAFPAANGGLSKSG